MITLKDNLLRLKNSLNKAKELGVDPKKVASSASLIDYKEKRKEHYHNVIKSCFRSLKEEFEKTGVGGIGFKSNLNNIERSYLNGEIDKAIENNEKILNSVQGLDEISKINGDLNVELRANIPLEIKKEIEEDFKEIKKCFGAGCYRSVMVLCGRILEIALHRKYYDATGVDILEKSPGIGLGNLIAKLKEKDVRLDPGITQQVHLVNQIRVFSVHKKKEEFNPSKEQCHAMILYTMDILSKLF